MTLINLYYTKPIHHHMKVHLKKYPQIDLTMFLANFFLQQYLYPIHRLDYLPKWDHPRCDSLYPHNEHHAFHRNLSRKY